MEDVHLLLASLWFGILGLLLALYVIFDGFTLGVGILSLFTKDETQRRIMMTSLSGVWDANESWLIVLGGALFGAFPALYGIILHGLYVPVSVMIMAMILRSISFDFSGPGARHRWALAFGLGSLVTAAAQGFSLGGVLSGLPIVEKSFVGSVWQWLSPFAVLTAVGVVFGYTLLGAGYVIVKTEGALQARAYRIARASAWLMGAAGVAVSVWTPLRFPHVAQRWFDWPNIAFLAPLPLAAAGAFYLLLRAVRKRYSLAPLMWSVAIFITSLGGLAASIYPYFIPGTLTIFETAASSVTLVFMLAGIGMLIPVMLIYNGYQYLVFRGKVRAGTEGY